ncbi:putative reverse transcriptase domain-containing protein, partial [Tanacetum coccineum]
MEVYVKCTFVMNSDTDEDSIDYPDELEDDKEDLEEDDDEDLEEDPEEDPNEEHEPEDEDTKEKEPSEGSDETEPFEEDETAALIDAFAAGSPPFPLPPTSLAYDHAPLGHKAAMICMRDDIPEEDMPPQRRFVLTAPPPKCDVAESSAAAARPPRGQYDFVDTVETGQGLIRSPSHDARTIAKGADRAEGVGYVRALQASKHRMMTSIKEINLRVSYQAQVRRRESKDFYTQLHDAQTDRRDIRLEIDVNRVLLVRLETLETHMSRMEWQRQSAEDFAVRQMMRTHVLEARARIDTVEDAGIIIIISICIDIVIISHVHCILVISIIMPVTRQGANDVMTPKSIQAMIDRAIQRNSTHTQDDAGQSSSGGLRRPVQPARVCSYTDFMKCQPLNFKGTEGVVGLSQWLKKMESVFHISGCTVDNQGTLKKKLTDKYCPKGEIKKLEIELWNLRVRGNDVAAHTQRFQELSLMCTKFLADETEKVDKYISGLPNVAKIPKELLLLLAEYEATRGSGNGDDSQDSSSGERRQSHVKSSLLLVLFREMLSWWNSYVKTISQEVVYGMTWKTLKKIMTDKYCPRGEIKKLEIELWNLKVKGTDVLSYNQRFQESALMCGRMFPEESDEVEKYFGGLPDMIQGKHQAKNKRKLDDNSRSNQNQQQPFKRKNMARAYTAGPKKRANGRSKPLWAKRHGGYIKLIGFGQAIGFDMKGWDRSKGEKSMGLESFKDIIEENFIAIEGKWIPFSTPILIISVYAPQDFNEKKLLWSRLTSLMSDWHGETIIIEDFNEVRWAHESNDGVSDANAIIRIKNKLKVLKNILKEWSKTKREDRSKQKRDCLTNLEEIDRHIDQGLGDQSDLDSRLDFTNQLLDLEKKESIDLYQKAKIKWAIEGDENSKFVAPDWTRPIKLKEFPRFLSEDQANSLELPIMHDEVKKAVWDCGSNKVPGPDSFTFEFFKKFWYLIESDVFNAVAHFFQSGQFPTGCNLFFITLILKVVDAKLVNDFRPISPIGCIYKIIGKILANRFLFVIGDLVSIEQSAFIKGRQILDGPFILNEMISWCKRHKHKAMMLKIDFQKAYDSVRWDFLDYILTRFKFRSKWRAWIQGCFSSCIGSILVNGAPTREFKFQRGLRQGDPLVPFLFLLVMESLHISFSRIIDRGLFSPINIGHDNPVTLSHLFYADDAIFISKWSTLNVVAITGLLRYFHMASRLKVNFHKSSLIGVSINPNDVGSMANVVGCKASKLPFTYLSVNVGDNMTRAKAWSGVCSKLLLVVINCLEAARNKFFIGAENDKNKMTWIAWKKIFSSKAYGGLGVSSIRAFNYALLFKWIWRFKNDPHALWVRVVKAIYGEDGLLF